MRTAAAKGKSSWRLVAAGLALLLVTGAAEASRFTPSASTNLLEKQGINRLAAAQPADDIAAAFASAPASRFPLLTAADREALTAPLAGDFEAARGDLRAEKLASGGQTWEIRSNLWQFQRLTTISHPSRFGYARARWYDPRNASWLSEDDLGDVDSPNLYAYVGWRPHMATDPTGEIAIVDNLIGGAVSLVAGLAIEGALTLLDDEHEWNYSWTDAGVDFGLGFATSGLSTISKAAKIGKVGKYALRAGAEVSLDTGAEVIRREIKGEDYDLGDLAVGAGRNFLIGEAGAAAARGVRRVWSQAPAPHISSRTATELRNSPGFAHVASALPASPRNMLRGTEGNVGLIPQQIAERLSGRQFGSFRQFREAFWREVADSPYAAEFQRINIRNLARMRKGFAPLARSSQMHNGQFKFLLHHRLPISQGGGVYDLGNLLITSPRYHAEVLERGFHAGR